MPTDDSNSRQAMLDELYRRANAAIGAWKGKVRSFRAAIPEDMPSDLVDKVIEFYQDPDRNWKVKKERHQGASYLTFTPRH